MIVISGLLLTAVAQADVYRSVDESGNVVFTDKPSEDAEKIEVQGVQTVPNEGATDEFTYTPAEREAEVLSPYTAVMITSPENDTTVSQNDGNVSVSVSVEPALNSGDKLVLLVDGSPAGESAGGQFQLTNLDRGTHSLVAVVQNAAGKELISSSPVSFTVQRHSKKHKPSTVGKQPKPPAKPPAAPKP